MRSTAQFTPDWRDSAAYSPLLEADRSLIAWEWLRRNAQYRAAALRLPSAAGSGGNLPESFGLVRFEDPALAVPEARPLWRLDADPLVLPVRRCHPAKPSDWFEIASLGRLALLDRGREAEHLLISDGLRTIRLDGPAGCFAAASASLAYEIHGIHSAEAPLLALRRFIHLCRTGRFSPRLHAPERRARRWVLMLRAFDALEEGASQREIAEALLSRTVAAPRWRSRESSIRSQVQRLVRSARAITNGYRALLSRG